MKALLLTLLLTTTSVTATELTKDEGIKFCEDVSEMSGLVMVMRQEDVTITEALVITKGAFKELIMDAYDTPKYSTDKFKKLSINEFRNKWHLACLKNI